MMLSLFAQSELADLIIKVENNERLDFNDGIRLMESKDVLALGYMADMIRVRKNGNKTYFAGSGNLSHDHNRKDLLQTLAEIEEELTAYPANGFMFYGQSETKEDQVNQLLKLREDQDKTGRFLSFAPLPFYPKDIELQGNMGVDSTTGFEDLKMLAVSRILLDNVDHIKAFWILLGPKLAQVSLNFGVDDIGGAVTMKREEDETRAVMYKNALVTLIKKAGRTAVERDTNYRILKEYEA